MRAGVFLLLVFFGGCATQSWVRPDTPPDIADRDDIDCQRWARQEASNRASGFYDGPIYSQRSISRPEPPLDARRTYDEASLSDFCMRSRGYVRQ